MVSFLTNTQIKVLKLRKKGLTQEEIAKLMNTSRANICMIERRARENIEKAKDTLKIYKDIISPIKLVVDKDTDVFQIPKLIYETSNKHNIHINYNSLELIDMIHNNMKNHIEKRIVKKPFVINILEDGNISFMDYGLLENDI